MANIDKIPSEAAGHIEEVKDASVSTVELTPEESKSLLRRIDRCLLPTLALCYFFQFLDKSSLSAAAILNLPQDLHLKGQQYSWAGGIYYLGYLAASYPVGWLMIRWRVGKTIATSIIIWSAILMLTATCSNGSGLLANRFFLGVSEAAVAPGLTVVISMWYKRSEQPWRHAAWFLGNTCAGLFGGLIGYGLGHIRIIAPWKAVFLILGGVTIIWGACIFFFLPDTPDNAWFLSKDDRKKAIIRVKDNLTGIKSDTFKWQQCKEALLDAKTWFLVLIQICANIPNGGATTFGTIVIQGFGFSTFDTLLLSSTAFVVQLALVILVTVGSSRIPNTRTYWMMLNYAIALAGAAIVRELPAHNKGGRLAGICLLGGYSANFPLLMSLASSNVGGFTKKSTVNAMSFIAYCAGNVIGPQLFFSRQAPSYDSGFLAMMVCLASSFVLTLCFRLYLIWENNNRDKATGSMDVGVVMEAEAGTMVNLMDKTDKEIPQFRYIY